MSTKPSGSSTSIKLASGMTYEPLGPLNAVTGFNGVSHALTYDLDYRTTAVTASSSSGSLLRLAYGFDNNDNVTSVTDALNAANTQTLGYDVINRLTSAVSGSDGYGSYRWTIDKAGNRLTQTLGSATTTYSYTSGTNRLASLLAGGVTTNVITNANGNITSIPPANSSGLATFAYNVANRLSSVSGSPTGANFIYDYQGKRITKTDPGSNPTYYSYALDGTTIEENANGTVTDYVYADGRPLGTFTPATSTLSYLLTDRQGVPQKATSSTQAVAWSTTYQPFGTTGLITGSITQGLRFPGQYADPETGFYYNMHRDYMPNLGRYPESDPIGLGGGVDTYAYSVINPLSYEDRLGLNSQYSAGLSGTFAVFVGGSGSTTVGVSIPDNPWDVGGYQLFSSIQGNILGGAGLFGGVGVTGGYSSSDGELPAGFSSSFDPYFEADIGSLVYGAVGYSATFSMDPACPGKVSSISQSFSPPLKYGDGLGVFIGGGYAGTLSYTTPTLRSIYRSAIWSVAGSLARFY